VSAARNVKVTMNLTPRDVAVLRGLAAKRATTMTEIIRQAIGLEKFLDDERELGSKLLVHYPRTGEWLQILWR
jgi:hypothetical protein